MEFGPEVTGKDQKTKMLLNDQDTVRNGFTVELCIDHREFSCTVKPVLSEHPLDPVSLRLIQGVRLIQVLINRTMIINY